MNRTSSIAIVLAVVLGSGCAGPRPDAPPSGDRELSRLNNTARAAYDRGSLPLAVTLYGQAMTRACALDDATAIGNAAYNLAACRIQLGDYEAARGLLREAESELARAKGNLADVLLLEAKVAHWQGRREEAVHFAEQVLANPASFPAPVHRVEVALLNGNIACDDEDVEGARAALHQARQEARAPAALGLSAGLEQLSGRIYLLEGQPAAAGQAFDQEATFYQQARLSSAMVGALRRSGAAWRVAGQPASAAERYFRAARTSLAQELLDQAIHGAELAVSLAEEAGEDTLAARARQLQAEIIESLARRRP